MFVMNLTFSINLVISKSELLLCTTMCLLILQITLPVIDYAKEMILR